MSNETKNLSALAASLNMPKTFATALEIAAKTFPGIDYSPGAVIGRLGAEGLVSAVSSVKTKGASKLRSAIVGDGFTKETRFTI